MNRDYTSDSQANSAYQDITSTNAIISENTLNFSFTATTPEDQNLAITGLSVATADPRYDLTPASSGLAVHLELPSSMGQAAAVVVTNAGAQAERLVSEFLARPDAREQIFNLFNGGKAAPDAAWNGAFNQLMADLQSGQGNLRVELRSNADLEGGYGAFSATGTTGQPTIYLNADWIGSGPNAQAISAVLVEEIGHALDARLNGSADTAGDEGAIFSAKLRGLSLEASTLQAMAAENDSGMLRLDGQNLTVEFSVYDANTSDTDGDGVVDANDLDDDNDGILDSEEQRVIGAAPIRPDNITFNYAQNIDGYSSRHTAASAFRTGTTNDPAFLFDGDPLTELHMHFGDIYEFSLPRTLGAGSSFTLTEGTGSNDAKMAVLGSLGTTDANGNTNNATGGGQGWNTVLARFNGVVVAGTARTVSTVTDLETLFILNGNQPLVSTDGNSILLYAGLSDATKTFTSSIGINHFQLVALDSHGGWAEMAVTSEVNAALNTDNDSAGIPNSRDLDSDNDGISDLYEAVRSNTDDLAVKIDTNRDGTITQSEVNTYNAANSTTYGLSAQGVWSFFGSPSTANDGNQPADSDGDGIRDFLDLDSDNDGIPDTVEARPSTNFKTNDGNVSDNDSDGDGVIDIFDTVNGFGGSFGTPVNSDGSGDGTSFSNSGKPTRATVDTGVDNVTTSDIKAALTAGDGKYAKLKETTDVWVVDMGTSLPVGATVTIVAMERGATADKLNIQQCDSTGASTSNLLQWQPTKKDTYQTFTYTITADSRYLKFTTSNNREFRIDAISWGYGSSSSAPVPDYIDTDSDNDGNLDKYESGLTRTGVDANKDGIDDGINASYQDPDGVVAPSTSVSNYNLTTSGTLTNNDGTPADVDYRSLAAPGSLTVSNLEVNEGSPYAIFSINGTLAASVQLFLVNDGDPSTADANLLTDTTNALEYSTNGTTWTTYLANSTITVGTGGLLVRVGITNDNPSVYEGPEGFRLQVKYDIGITTGSTFSMTAAGGYGLILDDGTGDYWSGNTNISADPDATPPTLDDDSPIIINDVVVNEASQFGAVFTLNTSAGYVLNLSLATTNSIAPIGNATLGTDTGTPLQYSLNDGVTWIDYTWNGSSGNRPTAPDSGTIYVRVPITNDSTFEGQETFKLVATRDNNGITIPSTGGLGTIRDDGIGNYWLNNSITPADETQLNNAGLSLDDDSPINIFNPIVNEASNWIVFELEGQPSQAYTPSLVTTGSGAGYASPTSDYSTTIEYWNGTAWATYNGGTINLQSSGSGLIRVGIINDNPAVYEGPETFKLVATSTNNVVSTGGIGTIRDDGLGVKITFSGTNDGTVIETTGPGAGFDDERVQQNVPPTVGPIDITSGTDSGANDTITNNGNPVITFTGNAGLTISLFGPDGTPLILGTNYNFSYANGTYTVTLLDADGNSGNGNQPFGTYRTTAPNIGSPTGNGSSVADGLYTIKATDISGNQAIVGTFVIDTTPPGLAPNSFGPLDITTPTDSGADDTITNNAHPVIEFTGEAGLTIDLYGPDGTPLALGTQYTYTYANGKYSVTLLDAIPGNGNAADPFGTYFNGTATTNNSSTSDGTYTIKAKDLAGNQSTVGQFVIDTTKPGQSPAQALGPIDITPGTDTGANDTTTADGNPVIEFTGEPGLTISLLGANGDALLEGVHYTVSYDSGKYSVKLLDADPSNPGYQPFGDYDPNGVATSNALNVADGTYTIKATDVAGNQSQVGQFVIDTSPNNVTPPTFGPLDITQGTDTGPNDTTTANGLPVITFTGPSGLAGSITLQGVNGTPLNPSQYTVTEPTPGNYVVTLLDADTSNQSNNDPFGTYNTSSPYAATGNPTNTGDGLYTIIYTNSGPNPPVVTTVGTFVIDTTRPGIAPNNFGPLDITTPTDSGADDNITNKPNPVLTFTGEAGLIIQLFGPADDVNPLASSQYTVVSSPNGDGTYTYTVTLVDGNTSVTGNGPFGTYFNGSPTNNPTNSADGTYTIRATDLAGNKADVGQFVIDTTPPGTQPNLFGPLDITAGTDSGANDNITNNGNPVMEFTGEAGLIINLYGPDGTLLTLGTQYTYTYANGKYTVTLLDSDPSTAGIQSYGTYLNGIATGNGPSTRDGTYTIKATDVAGNQATVDQFVIDTTPFRPNSSPAMSALDITPGTDTGANDTTTADGNPVIEFTGEPGLTISLLGPDNTALLEGVHYTVSYDSGTGTYSVKLLDAKPNVAGYQPFGDYDPNGVATGNSASTLDGTYTIKATDLAGNKATVGTFVIDTSPNNVTPPTFGPLDITQGTDTGANDTTTANGLPVITFTGPSGLLIGDFTLQGVNGTTLAPGQYSVSSNTVNNVTTYTVTLLDADTSNQGNNDPFGTYNTAASYAPTGNPTNTGDGLYRIIYTHLSLVSPVGTFVIDTTPPGLAPNSFGPLDITTPTDSGADDNTTNKPNPVLTFTGEAGLTIELFGPTDDVNPLASSQYTVASSPNGDGTYTYTVTLVDGNTSVTGNGPFGTYFNGSPTNNPTNSADGTYTIRSKDLAGNKADVGQFIIDTTLPGQFPSQPLGQLDIIPEKDTGANDTTTSNGNPVLTFTGEPGLTISLLGPDGSPLLPGTQYTVSYNNGTYTVTLLDSDPSTSGIQSYGTYLNGFATGNGPSTRDGTYTIKATDVAGNQSTVGSFVIDTTPPGINSGLGALDITPATDSGADDTTTSNGNPVLEFNGEPGLDIKLYGPDGSLLLSNSNYTVSYTNGKYIVTLLDADPLTAGNQPFGTYKPNGTATGNGPSTRDGTYTIKATDLAGNQSTVGTFVIDTTPPATSPGLSPLNITTPTDSGADDTVTNNGHPILEFNGEPGLQVSLFGPDGTPLEQGTQYTVNYLNGKYTVTLNDAIPGGSANAFGTNSNGSPTGNPASTADGLYTIKVNDLAGNQSTVGSFTIDTTAPTVVVTSSVPNLAPNQTATITFTFNEVPVGFIAGDVTTTGGTISNFAATADPKVYTATFTRAASGNTNCSVTVPAASYTDTAANPGTAGSTSISIDTQGPSLVISSDKPNLEYRQTAVITFTFSETPTGFDLGDVNLAGGTLGNLVVDPNNPRVYTATFFPTIDFIGNGLISVASGTFADSFGNLGTGASINPAISIFNRIRGFSATGDNSSNVGQNIGNANTGSGTSVVLYNPVTGASNGNVVPFPGFMGEVRVSRADTNGDGILDMIVSPGVGGGPVVKVIDSATGRTLDQFTAYDPSFTGGMFVAVADINQDGFSEIITGAGAGGGPHVKVFDGRTHAESASFFAYTPAFTGGVSVAAYDFNHDGVLDIVTGAGPGGGPHVKVFDGATMAQVKEFMAYTLNFTGGVYVAAGDFLSDGRYEIITGAGAGGGPHVKVWDYETLNLVAERMAYDNYTYSSGLVVDILFGGGVRVGLADGNDDGIMDVIVGAGPGGGPHVKVLAGRNLDVIRNFFSGDITDSRGVFVGS